MKLHKSFPRPDLIDVCEDGSFRLQWFKDDSTLVIHFDPPDLFSPETCDLYYSFVGKSATTDKYSQEQNTIIHVDEVKALLEKKLGLTAT